jgi:putative SOS response-associated peptidase YedK
VTLRPRWNLCPGEELAVVVQVGAERRLGTVRWGFVPAFAGSPAEGPRAINARAESVAARCAAASAAAAAARCSSSRAACASRSRSRASAAAWQGVRYE